MVNIPQFQLVSTGIVSSVASDQIRPTHLQQFAEAYWKRGHVECFLMVTSSNSGARPQVRREVAKTTEAGRGQSQANGSRECVISRRVVTA